MVQKANFTGAGDWSTGVADFGDIIKTAMDSYKQGYDLRNMPKNAEMEREQKGLNLDKTREEITAAMFKNHLDRLMGADERKAGINNVNAQTGYYGAQTKSHDVATRASEMELDQLNLLRSMLQNSNQQSQAAPQQQTLEQPAQAGWETSKGGVAAPSFAKNDGIPLSPNEQKAYNQQQPQNAQIAQSLMNDKPLSNADKIYKENPMLRKYFAKLGFDAGQTINFNPTTGEQIVTTKLPSGQIEHRLEKIGTSSAESERNSKSLGELEDRYSAVSDDVSNLDNIIESLRNPNSKEVLGPVNSFLAYYNGSPEEQDLLGQFSTMSGNIALDAAKSIKGAFTGRDMTLLNSVKGNVKDPYGVFVGKAKAMSILAGGVQARLKIVSEMQRQGYSKIEAEETAKKTINFDGIAKQVEKTIRDAERDAYYSGLSQEEASRLRTQGR